MTLFEINEELREILDFLEVDEETGEVTSNVNFDRLNELTLERDRKLEGIGLYAKELMVEIDALKEEVDNLKNRIKSKTNKLERLKGYISFNLNLNGDIRFETPKIVLSFRKSKAVNVDENSLPKQYFVKKVELYPDKVAIKKLLESGKKIRGALLVEKQNLQIK